MANTALRNDFPMSHDDRKAPVIEQVQQGEYPPHDQDREDQPGLGIALDHTKALRVSRQLKRRR